MADYSSNQAGMWQRGSGRESVPTGSAAAMVGGWVAGSGCLASIMGFVSRFSAGETRGLVREALASAGPEFPNPDRSWRDQHPATHACERRTARKTASTSRGLTPPGILTLMAPITISMQARRRSCAAWFAWTDFTDTTGTKVGIASPGKAKRPSLAALIQFDRCCGARSCRRATSAITAPGAIASATIRPFSSSLPPSAADHARYFRAPLNDLRVVTNVDHIVHTILDPKRIAIVHHSPPLSYVG